MSKMTDKTITGRRDFLKLAGLAASGGAIAVVAGDGAEAQADAGAKSKGSLYRETDHVRKYYQLARF